MYNLMTCQGFDPISTCSMAWGSGAFLVLLSLCLGSWAEGLGYNTLFGVIGVVLPYIIVISIFGSVSWAFLAALLGLLIGGFAGVMFE
jgi:hypothetical protein